MIEEDLHLVQGLNAAGIRAIYGDAAHATILAAAHPERARLVVATLPDAGATRAIVRDVRRLNPQVPILAVSRLAGQYFAFVAEPQIKAETVSYVGGGRTSRLVDARDPR